MSDRNNSLEEIVKKDKTKLVLFSIASMVIITTVTAVMLLFTAKRESKPDIPSQNSSQTSIPSVSADGNSSENSFEQSSPDFSVPAVSENSPEESPEESKETSVPEESEDMKDPEHGWIINNLGYTYIYYDRGLEQFTASEKIKNGYIQTVETLRNALNGVNFNHILVPTQVEFTEIPTDIKREDDFYNHSQKKFIESVYSKLGENINGVNIYDSVKERYEKGDYLYFKTDINWTADAAYIAYTEFCKSCNLIPQPVEAFPKLKFENFLGRFYTATENKALEKNPDVINYYDIDSVNPCEVVMYKNGAAYKNRKLIYENVSDISNGYNVFLGDSAGRFKITTSLKNGKRLLVIGDTSANPFVPFLTSHYEQIHFINPQYYKEGSITDFVKENKITDAVLINYTTNASKLYYQKYFEGLYNNEQEQ